VDVAVHGGGNRGVAGQPLFAGRPAGAGAGEGDAAQPEDHRPEDVPGGATVSPGAGIFVKVSTNQPDLCACGGITEARKIAAIGKANRIRLAPHGPHGPAGALANFHFDAATANFYIQETRVYTGQFDMDLHEGLVPIVKDGYCELPDRPGAGYRPERGSGSDTPVSADQPWQRHRPEHGDQRAGRGGGPHGEPAVTRCSDNTV